MFLPDAVLAASAKPMEGHDGIVQAIDRLEERYTKTLHFIGNHYATIEGDEATGLTYCLAHHLYERDGEERDTLMVIRYDDRCVRTSEGWRFSRRTLSIDWVEDRPLTVRTSGA